MSGRNDPSAEDSSCSCWAAAPREGCVTREPFPERCKSVGRDFFLLWQKLAWSQFWHSFRKSLLIVDFSLCITGQVYFSPRLPIRVIQRMMWFHIPNSRRFPCTFSILHLSEDSRFKMFLSPIRKGATSSCVHPKGAMELLFKAGLYVSFQRGGFLIYSSAGELGFGADSKENS